MTGFEKNYFRISRKAIKAIFIRINFFALTLFLIFTQSAHDADKSFLSKTCVAWKPTESCLRFRWLKKVTIRKETVIFDFFPATIDLRDRKSHPSKQYDKNKDLLDSLQLISKHLSAEFNILRFEPALGNLINLV